MLMVNIFVFIICVDENCNYFFLEFCVWYLYINWYMKVEIVKEFGGILYDVNVGFVFMCIFV